MTFQDEQERASELLEQRARYMDGFPLLGFVPTAKQWDYISHDSVKRKLAAGGNQFGKTTIVVTESYCHAIGCRPYLPYDHPNFRVLMPDGKPIPVPNRGQMCGNDFPVGFAENIWPTWKEWISPEVYYVRKHERGTPRIIEVDVSGFPWADPRGGPSLIYAHAYEQGRAAFQGIRTHWVMDDEPPTRPVYIEQQRGLLRYAGKWMGAMSMVEDSQIWIYDMFEPPNLKKHQALTEEMSELERELGRGFRSESFYLVEGSMYDNIRQADGSGGLSESAIEEFKHDLEHDEIELQVRVYGKRRSLMGTEFGKIWDTDIHVLEEHEDPRPDCCFAVFCDAHPTKAYAILWVAIDSHDCYYCFHESYDEGLDDLDKIADYCKQVEGWRRTNRGGWSEIGAPYSPQIRLIDPLAKTYEKGIGMTAIQYFALHHQQYWAPWAKGDKQARTRLVKGMLKPGKGPIARPRLTFSPNCEYTINQMPRYREKRPKDPDTDPRRGEFIDVDADMVQCVIAAAASGLTFEMLSNLKTPTQERPAPQSARPARSTAGYNGPDVDEREPWEREVDDPWRQREARLGGGRA